MSCVHAVSSWAPCTTLEGNCFSGRYRAPPSGIFQHHSALDSSHRVSLRSTESILPVAPAETEQFFLKNLWQGRGVFFKLGRRKNFTRPTKDHQPAVWLKAET
ncbi:hypothetical protein chiPu_0012671 [Chiloscyllium punctatum]|uniref:Uncharacterized protein n=1 Tax=Chiloscyllium punctatum TaxID=137246 RepID=A0A401SUY7_CHIPU|nr:hypothetical protein [Chiloscyllium punctatum]